MKSAGLGPAFREAASCPPLTITKEEPAQRLPVPDEELTAADEKYVISLDDYDMSRDGIKHRNIRVFLLTDKWD